MKKILVIDQGEHIGGAEIFLAELLSKLDSDYEIKGIHSGNVNHSDLYKKTNISFFKEELPSLKPFSIKSLCHYKKTQLRLAKVVSEYAPDLIISNTVRTHLLISKIASKLSIPLIWMAHDLTFPKWLLKHFGKYPRHIVCCSQHVQQHYLSCLKNHEKTSVLYPYGVFSSDIQNYEKKKVIGMVGNFSSWKGQDIFIKMASEIYKQHPEYNFKIFGRVYENDHNSVQFFNKCKQMISEHHLQDVLTISESNNILKDISDWEILVHCSKNPEPLGRVILEGMTVGCAVVASNKGGPTEIIEQGVTGILTPPSISNVAHSVKNLIEDSERRQGFQFNGQKFINTHFLWGKKIAVFKDMLDKVFNK